MCEDPAERYQSFLEMSLFDSSRWEGLVTVCFSFPRSGWIYFWIATTGYPQNLTIHCSDVYNPFPELVLWLEAIVQDRYPCAFTIDEEGTYRTLRVDRLSGNLLDFQIYDGDLDEYGREDAPILLRTKVEKRQLVSEMVTKLVLYIEAYDITDQWCAMWDDEDSDRESVFKSLNLETLKAYLRSNPENDFHA